MTNALGLRFPGLEPGDLVRLLSPASYPDEGWVLTSTAILTSWELTVDVGRHALDEHGYMAGNDQDLLDDLNAAYRDPAVRAIVTTRGGAGAYRLLDGLDIDSVRRDPKPLVGFSDITYLHLAVWQHCRMPGIHGCIAGPRAASTVRRLLMTDVPSVLQRDENVFGAELFHQGSERNCIGCIARGRETARLGRLLWRRELLRVGAGWFALTLTWGCSGRLRFDATMLG